VARGWVRSLYLVVFSYVSKAAVKTGKKLEEGKHDGDAAAVV
jgi:hypothetical protein